MRKLIVVLCCASLFALPSSATKDPFYYAMRVLSVVGTAELGWIVGVFAGAEAYGANPCPGIVACGGVELEQCEAYLAMQKCHREFGVRRDAATFPAAQKGGVIGGLIGLILVIVSEVTNAKQMP